MRRRRIVNDKHAVALVEASLQEGPNFASWASELSRAFSRLLPSMSVGVGAIARADATYKVIHGAMLNLPFDPVPMLQALIATDPDVVESLYFRLPHLASILDVARGLPRDVIERHPQFFGFMGAGDIIGITAHAGRDISLVMMSMQPTRVQFAPAERLLLRRSALHVEAGMRLRAEPGVLVAVLGSDGKVRHAEGAARARDVQDTLQSHVSTMEIGRLRANRDDPEVLDLWTAMRSGRYCFVERVEAGAAREYLVFDNANTRRPAASLTRIEAECVELTCRGLNGKGAAYALGLPETTVSRLLHSAAFKVGCESRLQLIRLATLLLSAPTQTINQESLSTAEREVLRLLQDGFSNAEIAEARQTSPRTVANQVASMLAKTDLPSRRNLASVRP